MPASPKPEHAPDDVAAEPAPDDVDVWRLDQLTRAGYTDPILSSLAADHEVDLHLACELLASGCDEATAYLILS